jgi:hypothetical protein
MTCSRLGLDRGHLLYAAGEADPVVHRLHTERGITVVHQATGVAPGADRRDRRRARRRSRPPGASYGASVTARTYLLILGEGAAIAWVLREQRMAFPATPRAEVARLGAGDQLFLYATRGAWHNPGRDRGRIIGTATVSNAVRRLDEPITVAGMRFASECELAIGGVAAYPGGLELQPLVEQLDAFPKPHAWSLYLRRSLLELSARDAALLRSRVKNLLVDREAALPTYPASFSRAIRPAVRSQAARTEG